MAVAVAAAAAVCLLAAFGLHTSANEGQSECQWSSVSSKFEDAILIIHGELKIIYVVGFELSS